MKRTDYKKKRQLSMICDKLQRVTIELKKEYELVDSGSEKYSEEFFKESWTSICKELNGGYDENIFQQLIIDDPFVYKGSTFYVKNPSGILVSTATVLRTKNDDRAILHMVGTRSDARGNGAASAVCAACVNYSIDNGIKSMTLKTDDFRIPAIKIYYSLGFVPIVYDNEMYERWYKIAENIGWKQIIMVDEKGTQNHVVI